MDTILIKGLQLIIALALLIILHEGGSSVKKSPPD
jgi:hypothetical protein